MGCARPLHAARHRLLQRLEGRRGSRASRPLASASPTPSAALPGRWNAGYWSSLFLSRSPPLAGVEPSSPADLRGAGEGGFSLDGLCGAQRGRAVLDCLKGCDSWKRERRNRRGTELYRVSVPVWALRDSRCLCAAWFLFAVGDDKAAEVSWDGNGQLWVELWDSLHGDGTAAADETLSTIEEVETRLEEWFSGPLPTRCSLDLEARGSRSVQAHERLARLLGVP